MGYEAALKKSWLELESIAPQRTGNVRFLADEYSIDLEKRRVLSLSCNIPAKDHTAILVLHYFTRSLKGLPPLAGEWVSFKQLEGGLGYYPAFKKRVIVPILRKYGSDPKALAGITERFKAKVIEMADAAVVIEAFDNVPVLLTVWKADEEFGPEANVLFDKNIARIFCTEDTIVMAGFVACGI
ncbi:MAG: DUF3786 domain-containing protein [Candidatus Omnitrophica bacterium]|nr:DUF3786 domain-containing protein [Candidatus Omnitrophota bacterium]